MFKFIRPIANGFFISSPFILYYRNEEAVKSKFKVYAQSEAKGILSNTLENLSEPKPKPIQIAQRLDNGRLGIKVQDLNKVLDKVGEAKVAIYAICGPSRTGKSFLLTRCVEYLRIAKSNSENSAATKECNPFLWNNQADPVTSGIWIWSEPLEVMLPNGNKIYVLLLDCQGCFDEWTSINEDVNIFSFATLFSSVQVFNIKHQIDESTIEFLEMFTGFADFIKRTHLVSNEKFQQLTILVRDFQLQGYDYGYHNSNGPSKANYKIAKLHPKSYQPQSHQTSRSNILMSYLECGVFLLPHPGKKITTSDDSDDLDEDFLKIELELFDFLFNPKNIVVKTINNVEQSGTELKIHVKQWAEQFEKSELPKVHRSSEANNQLQLYNAIECATSKYDLGMEKHLSGHYYQITEAQLHEKHVSLLEECFSIFSDHFFFFGGNKESIEFRDKVGKKTEVLYKKFQVNNLLKPEYCWYHKIIEVAKVAINVVKATFVIGKYVIMPIARFWM